MRNYTLNEYCSRIISRLPGRVDCTSHMDATFSEPEKLKISNFSFDRQRKIFDLSFEDTFQIYKQKEFSNSCSE